MKICYLCADHGIPILGRKGCSTHVRETCRSLREAGHEIFIVTPRRGNDITEYRDQEIIEVPPIESRAMGSDLRHYFYNRRMIKALAQIMRERSPDVMYERYSLYSTAGMRIAQRFHLPRILEVNSLLVEEQKRRIHFPLIATWVENRVVRSAPSVIVVSSPLRDAFLKRGIDAGRITIMPMAVDVRRFHPGVPPSALPGGLHHHGKTIIGYTGTLTAWHGIELLFEVAERIKALNENIVILIIGGDEQKVAEQKDIVDARRLGDYLVFAGSVPYTEVPGCISAMDVTVIPGSMEWASPTKLFEYQAMGKPSVAPRLVPVEDVLTDGVEGFLFSPGNVEELTRCLLRLHRNPSERLEMGRRARRKVLERHAWEHNTRRILEMFDRMLAEKRKSRG